MAQPPPAVEEEHLSSFFPSPPPFYKHFTAANLKALEEAKASLTSNSASDNKSTPHFTAEQLLALPTELRYLVPPEPPTEDQEYTVFQKKEKWKGTSDFENIIEWIQRQVWSEEFQTGSLQDGWKYEQLYPSSADGKWSSLDRQNYLFRFLRSILLNFVELLGILASNPNSNARLKPGEDRVPDEKDEKLKDILNLVVNMHALINEYRPHQARETLIGLMEEQVERKRKEVEGVRRMGQKVRETLEGFERGVPSGNAEAEGVDVDGANREERRVEGQRAMWGVMDEVLGHS